MPNLYIIAGCNGAGKTTASYTVLPEMLNCKEFVNADEIAKGLSPFQPETVAFEAGRIMLNRIHDLIHQRVDFGFETTLSSKGYSQLIKEARLHGYVVFLIFIWLESVELAKNRVTLRVSKGGHNIPADVIERRYKRGLNNFFNIYHQLADVWAFYNNSSPKPDLIAEGTANVINTVYNNDLWQNISY